MSDSSALPALRLIFSMDMLPSDLVSRVLMVKKKERWRDLEQ